MLFLDTTAYYSLPVSDTLYTLSCFLALSNKGEEFLF